MESDDYGFIEELKKSKYPKLPNEETKKKEFIDKGIPFLKEVKDNDLARQIANENGVRVESSGFVTFLEVSIGVLVILLFVGALVGGYFFLTYVKEGKFQSVDNSTIINDIDAPVNVDNTYDFKPSTTNQIYVNNTISFPDWFLNSIIKLMNQTG